MEDSQDQREDFLK